MICCVTKATPIHFINHKCHIKQLKSRKSDKTCLSNRTQSISHHITPLFLNALRADTHTHTHTHWPANQRFNSFLQRIINWCWFYKVQALIDAVECVVICISITGLEEAILHWSGKKFMFMLKSRQWTSVAKDDGGTIIIDYRGDEVSTIYATQHAKFTTWAHLPKISHILLVTQIIHIIFLKSI